MSIDVHDFAERCNSSKILLFNFPKLTTIPVVSQQLAQALNLTTEQVEENVDMTVERINHHLFKKIQEMNNVKLFDFAHFLEDVISNGMSPESCMCKCAENEVRVFFDDMHFTTEFNKLLANKLRETVL